MGRTRKQRGRNAAAIEGDRTANRDDRVRKERNSPTEAETNASDAVWCNVTAVAQPPEGGVDVVAQPFFRERLHMRHAGSEVIVRYFNSGRRGAVIKFGRDRDISFSSKPLSDVRNVSVYAKRFLENEHAGKRTLLGRKRDERIHRSAVGYCERVFFRGDVQHTRNPPSEVRKLAIA